MKEKVILKNWIEKMKLRQWLQALSPVLAPVVIFSLWLAFAKLDKRASAVSKLLRLLNQYQLLIFHFLNLLY